MQSLRVSFSMRESGPRSTSTWPSSRCGKQVCMPSIVSSSIGTTVQGVCTQPVQRVPLQYRSCDATTGLGYHPGATQGRGLALGRVNGGE